MKAARAGRLFNNFDGLLHLRQVGEFRTVFLNRRENAGNVPVLLADAPAEKGDENLHQHFAIVYGAMHFVVVDGKFDLSLDALEHVGEIAELVAFELRQNGFGYLQAVRNRIPGQELGMLRIGDVQKPGVELGVVGDENRGLSAENGEIPENLVYRRRVFDHLVGDMVDPGRFVRNHHRRFHERLECGNFLGSDDAVVVVDRKLDRSDFDDFVLALG